MKQEEIRIAVLGLGYVGLPLARLFATRYPVVGFDINSVRVDELNRGIDRTMEVEASAPATGTQKQP
jgi:UDP-N-acetyl-D-galactosamine dehydrogenase